MGVIQNNSRQGSRAQEDFKYRGADNFLPERSKRSGEQSEKLHEFPIVLSEKLPQ